MSEKQTFQEWYINKYKFSKKFFDQMNELEQNGLRAEYLAIQDTAPVVISDGLGWFMIINYDGNHIHFSNYHDALIEAVKIVDNETKGG